MPAPRFYLLATLCAGTLGGFAAAPAAAQSAVDDVGLLNPLVREYRPVGVHVGAITVYPSLDAGIQHDTNIYAEADNEKDDQILYLVPRFTADSGEGIWRFRGLGQLNVRRFLQYESENSTAGVLEGDVRFNPTVGQAFRAAASFRRVIEDRGDPEANDNVSNGPRRINVYRGDLGYRRETGVWAFGINGIAQKSDNLASRDVYRDLTSLAGQASIGRRVGGLTYATVTTFLNRRIFDKKFDPSGLQRDATTFGIRGGVQINSGGIFEGGASVGVFRFNGDDPSVKDYTGLSIASDLIYRPSERTAFLLDAFRGDVASFRGGAVSRTDTTLRLALQQEIRHNFFGRGGVFVRQSKFRGLGNKETTYGVSGELEYLLTRYISVAGGGRYSTRNADIKDDEFDRFRGNIELRFHL